eukprot:COSAG05_NODE_340_length_11109_cov_150.755041_11_plen_58_part_00
MRWHELTCICCVYTTDSDIGSSTCGGFPAMNVSAVPFPSRPIAVTRYHPRSVLLFLL